MFRCANEKPTDPAVSASASLSPRPCSSARARPSPSAIVPIPRRARPCLSAGRARSSNSRHHHRKTKFAPRCSIRAETLLFRTKRRRNRFYPKRDGLEAGRRMSDVAVAAREAREIDASLLIVDDDKAFLERLARAMEGRGFEVETADSVAAGLAAVEKSPPAFAVVDMGLGDGSGIEVISALKDRRPEARSIILTGYAHMATPVNAVKPGAVDYLSKPADADEVCAALKAGPGQLPELPENPMSADRVRLEHVQRVYELCGRNVSETARRLSMHRRTLQRILAKRAPR